MKKKINLFLDDERLPRHVYWIELPLVEWTIVRTYNEFVNAVLNNNINIVSFDHDLCMEHYQEYHRANDTDKNINYNNIKEKTGYHAAIFMAEYCIENKLKLPEYYIHSMNYMGKQNILSVLTSAQKVIDNNL